MQEGLDDHLDVMEHLKRSYADAEEVQAAERINALHEDITQLCRQDEQRITDIIQELQQEVQAAEERSTGPDPALHASSVTELEAAFRESRSRINSLENEARDLRDQQEQLQHRRQGVETHGAATARQIRAADPKLRNQLSLYANISRILWKDVGPDTVAGSVSDRQRADVRPFELDAALLPQFELVNKLWDVIA